MIKGILEIKWNNAPLGEKLHELGYKYLYEIEEEEKSIFTLMNKNHNFRVYLHIRTNGIVTIETESVKNQHLGKITHNYTFDRYSHVLSLLQLVSMVGE